MDIDYVMIGRRIQEERKLAHMTQAGLAEAAGLSNAYVSSIETGRKQASLAAVVYIANALGITVDEILCGNELHNPVEYQSSISRLIAGCPKEERRFLFELIASIEEIFRKNGWELRREDNKTR